MAFKKNVWQGSKFEEKLGEEEASRRLDDTAFIDHLIAVDGQKIKCKIIEIGDWNMDANISVLVTHGLTLSKIRTVNVIIRNDDNDRHVVFGGSYNVAGAAILQEDIYCTPIQIRLSRDVDGYFDNASYDSTSYNRGWITIWYED